MTGGDEGEGGRTTAKLSAGHTIALAATALYTGQWALHWGGVSGYNKQHCEN